MNSDHGQDDTFVMEMITCQRRLYAYILSVVFDRERAKDILQNTNLVLLQKREDYEKDTNFGAWACKVAFYEILADRRRTNRSRHVFNDEMLNMIAAKAEVASQDADRRLEALESCLEGLPRNHQQLLQERYAPQGSVEKIAASRNKTPTAISCLLYRIRTVLVECIKRKLEKVVI